MDRFNYEKFLEEINKADKFLEFEGRIVAFLKNYLDTDVLKSTGSKGDKGVDAVYYVHGANKLTLFQLKMGKPENKMDFDETQDIRNKMVRFLKSEESIHLSDQNLSEVATSLQQGEIKEVDLIIYTTKQFAKGINFGMNKENVSVETIGNQPVKVSTFYIDKDGFFEMLHTLKTNKTFNETIKGKQMEFDLKPGNYIEHSVKEGYSVMVKATDLYDKVIALVKTNHNIAALTHKNVRDFLGTVDEEETENISAGIRKTLTDPEDGKDFYAYHMGMVVLCENLQLEEKQQKGEYKLVITSPSFVNGAQSLGTLIKLKKADINKDASLTIRFIITPTTADTKAFSDKIVIRTNSSNPITSQMRYAFDPKQSFIARMFEDRGFYYDYRAAEKDMKNKLKDKVKKTESIIEFTNADEFKRFNISGDIKPDEIAASIYAVENKDVKAQRSNKNVFRYSSNVASEYYKVFYKNNQLRSFEEYFLPFGIHELMMGLMKDIFTTRKEAVTHDFRTNLFKLDFNQAKKIQWLLFIEYIKSQKWETIEDIVKYWKETANPFESMKRSLKDYLIEVSDDLTDSKTKKTSVKNFLINKKVTNMADAAR